jgi:hypothetical protein
MKALQATAAKAAKAAKAARSEGQSFLSFTWMTKDFSKIVSLCRPKGLKSLARSTKRQWPHVT